MQRTSRGPRRETDLVRETLRENEIAIREARRETNRLREAAAEARRFAVRARRRLGTSKDRSETAYPATDEHNAGHGPESNATHPRLAAVE